MAFALRRCHGGGVSLRLLSGVLLGLIAACSALGQTYTLSTFAGGGRSASISVAGVSVVVSQAGLPDTAPSIAAVTNGASNLTGAIAPGEIIVVYGLGLGPAQITQAHLGDDGRFGTQLAGTSVQFNGIPAPMIYTWDKQVAAVGRKSDKLTLDFLKNRLVSMVDHGVTYHGRVGQRELAKAFLASSLWLYPTNFHETSCITAMEAQAAGVFAITSKLAALPETLRMGHLIDPPNTTAEYEAEFLDTIKCFLEARQHTGYPSLQFNRKWVLENLSWQGVASEWDIMFDNWCEGNRHA